LFLGEYFPIFERSCNVLHNLELLAQEHHLRRLELSGFAVCLACICKDRYYNGRKKGVVCTIWSQHTSGQQIICFSTILQKLFDTALHQLNEMSMKVGEAHSNVLLSAR
jgi:hypothetical protein